MQSRRSDFARLWMKESYIGTGTEGNLLFPHQEKSQISCLSRVRSVVEGVFSVWEKETPDNQRKVACEVDVLLEGGVTNIVAVRVKDTKEDVSERVFLPKAFLESLPQKVKQSLPLLGVRRHTLFG